MGALLLTDFSPNDDIMAIITECVHVSTFHSVLNLIAYVMQSKHIHEYTFEFVELLRDAYYTNIQRDEHTQDNTRF